MFVPGYGGPPAVAGEIGDMFSGRMPGIPDPPKLIMLPGIDGGRDSEFGVNGFGMFIG